MSKWSVLFDILRVSKKSYYNNQCACSCRPNTLETEESLAALIEAQRRFLKLTNREILDCFAF